MLFELFDEDTAGWRPAPLLEPQPQDLPRHRPRDVDYTPLVQVFDVPVPQQMDVVPSKYIPVEHVEQLVPQERVQQRSFGEVGALLLSGLLEGLEQLVPQERVQPRTDEPLHGLGEHALLLRVQQQTAEQVANLHVPLAS